MAKDVHRRRRERLLEAIADTKHGRGMAIVPAATLVRRSNDVDYPFHQDADFRYLTGFPEPQAVAVLRPGQEHPFTLFVLPRNPEAETWTGRRHGTDEAKTVFGADEAKTIQELEPALPELLRGYDALYYFSGRRPDLDRSIDSVLRSLRMGTRDGVRVPYATIDLATVLHEHRLIKSPQEVECLRRAVQVTCQGHLAVMHFVREGVLERDVAAVLEYVFRRHGAEGVSYETVAASGSNACILHYTDSGSTLREGELLLVDAGALVQGYSGDITRTMPISGRFTPRQKDVYEVVLAAHRKAVDAIRPKAPCDAPHVAAVRSLTEGLVSLAVLDGDIEELIEKEAYKPYYMHRTGHWLGMDVHDVGRYLEKEKVYRPLEPGMALTVEPGIYLPKDDETVPADLRGIGIRIEDDVLVTSDGHEVLSAGLPITVEEIEEAMSKDLDLPL